ncbi:RHS repeat-associated core domain-containing protein [Bordetella sp. H567]|uniref:RHS repeat-associated core domain-containing protein n=1 Tax=Bordetella sp. H567 TaxID=1697043 RepID=UPI00082D7E8C|nr:RHS repeat-associated core domain-containing protein [Bordetella sp. H567]
MPDPDTTTPDTTPDSGGAASVATVRPDMNDDQVKDAIRKRYMDLAEDAATVLAENPPDKQTLSDFKKLLKSAPLQIDVPQEMAGRFASLRDQVVDEVAPAIMPSGDSNRLYVVKSLDATPPKENVAKAADPVKLFNGEFAYAIADFELNGAGQNFVFQRSYSQLVVYEGPLGCNWDHNYNLWLTVPPDQLSIVRSNGALGIELYTLHEAHGYWLPPDGVDAILQAEGDSFTLRQPDGTRIRYRPHPTLGPAIHVVARIEDRHGNYLGFTYEDGLLAHAEINSGSRQVDFTYDSGNRIVAIADFTGRTWRYGYDDIGNLVTVTLPATAPHRSGPTSVYDYIGTAWADTSLQHALTAIFDGNGRPFLENEYGTQLGRVDYRRVIRQRQGGGDILFDYADVIEDFNQPYDDHERPARQTIVTERDGRQLRYLFNRFGNALYKEEYAVIGGLPTLIGAHYRYNRDGNQIAAVTPMGVTTQSLFGRDWYERLHPRGQDYRPEADADLTAEARLQFGNVLSVVRRGRYLGFAPTGLAPSLWSAAALPDVFATDDADAIQKFSYEPEFNRPLTVSDARYTRSANPAFTEDADYDRTLTRYAYAPGNGFQHFLLQAVHRPTPTLPDGSAGAAIVATFDQYDANGRLLEAANAAGLRTRHTYFSAADGPLEGLLKATTVDPPGAALTTSVDRDPLGRVTRVYRPKFTPGDDRFVSEAEYNALDQVTRRTSSLPVGATTAFAYDRAGNLVRSELGLKDENQAPSGALVTLSRYDEEQHLVRQTVGDDTLSKLTRVVHDRAGRPYLTIAPSGRLRKLVYNERAMVARSIDDYAHIHAVTRNDYDADGRAIRIVNPRGFATRFTFDAFGRAVQTEDAMGNVTVRRFDKLGDLLVECTHEKQPDGSFLLLARRQFSYDELGRRITASASRYDDPPAVAAADVRTAFLDTAPGTLLTIQYYYDGVNNLVREVDQDGRVFVSSFDILGRPVHRVDPYGNEWRLAWDQEANLVRLDRQEQVKDANGVVLGSRHYAETWAYDELNRRVAHATPTGVVRHAYDSRGDSVAITDPLGNVIRNEYDVFGRLTRNRQMVASVLSPDAPQPADMRFAWDADDHKVSQTDALGRITRFVQDTAGRLASTVLPDGSADLAQYDAAGNMIAYRDRNGVVRYFAWDALNRNTSLQVDRSGMAPGLELGGASDQRAEFDGLGRMRRATNDFIDIRLRHDSLDRVLEETVTFTGVPGADPARAFVIQREVSHTGAVLRLRYPAGRELSYDRDVLDRVVAIAQQQQGTAWPGDPATGAAPLASFAYAGLQPSRLARAEGPTTDFRVDAGGRIDEVRHTVNGAPLLTVQYLHDALGNVRNTVETGQDFAARLAYTYDTLSRLVDWRTALPAAPLDMQPLEPPGQPLADPLPDLQAPIDARIFDLPATPEGGSWDYDLAGNRTRSTAGSVTTPYVVNALDQYTQWGSAARRYDGNGNLVEDESWSYVYDFRNQLVSATRKADQRKIERYYDWLGRLHAERQAGTLRLFLRDGQEPIEEYEGGQLARSTVWDPLRSDALIVSGGGRDNFLMCDARHSVRYLFDKAGKRNFYIYDPFGVLLRAMAPVDDNPFRYAGKRAIDETGKLDFVFRAYDPATGRFLQRDPKGQTDGPNFYAFVRNNPLAFSDPLGLESRHEFAGPTATLGAEWMFRNPSGFTLAVPNNFDRAKIQAYKQRIRDPLDRGVGMRSPLAGLKSKTDDIRAANETLADLAEVRLRDEQGLRPPNVNLDHTVELQHVIRTGAPGAETVRPQDHRWQDASLNKSQGASARQTDIRSRARGEPWDVSAGGVARERDLNKFWNRAGWRGLNRAWGAYNLAGGTYASISNLGDDIREGNWFAAGLDGSGFVSGSLEIGGMLAGSNTLLAAGRWIGVPGAVISSGVIGVRIGTNLYNNYVDKDNAMDAGSWVEERTGSRVLGASAAAGWAIGSAAYHAPEAAYDYAKETWTVDPDEVDWDRTLKPWKWL